MVDKMVLSFVEIIVYLLFFWALPQLPLEFQLRPGIPLQVLATLKSEAVGFPLHSLMQRNLRYK
jgi:hypothetical protein